MTLKNAASPVFAVVITENADNVDIDIKERDRLHPGAE
jgi:hypothetical protein